MDVRLGDVGTRIEYSHDPAAQFRAARLDLDEAFAIVRHP